MSWERWLINASQESLLKAFRSKCSLKDLSWAGCCWNASLTVCSQTVKFYIVMDLKTAVQERNPYSKIDTIKATFLNAALFWWCFCSFESIISCFHFSHCPLTLLKDFSQIFNISVFPAGEVNKRSWPWFWTKFIVHINLKTKHGTLVH